MNQQHLQREHLQRQHEHQAQRQQDLPFQTVKEQLNAEQQKLVYQKHDNLQRENYVQRGAIRGIGNITQIKKSIMNWATIELLEHHLSTHLRKVST